MRGCDIFGVVVLVWAWAGVGVITVNGFNSMLPSLELGELTTRMEKGKEEMARLHQRSLLPRGNCWKAALEELQVSCKGLMEENHSRLALKFVTCYNEMLGFPTIICEKYMPVSDCVKSMDTNGQATFREYFLHTQDLCYFIEYQTWQEKTSNAVNDVTNAVFDVTKTLEESKETQDKVLQSQQESLKVQSNIIKDNGEIYSMVMNVRDVFEDVQQSTYEQRQVVGEVFDKLTRMQKLVSWIQGEMSLIDMMGFYFACILFGVFITSSKRTQNSRVWICVLMVTTLGLERYMYNYLILLDNYSPEDIQQIVWHIRRGGAILGVVLIVYAAAVYRDPQVVQQNILAKVNLQLEHMTNQVQQIQRDIRMQRLMPQNTENDDFDDSSDADTFSDYTEESDLEMDKKQPIKLLPDNEDGPNDENRVPSRFLGPKSVLGKVGQLILGQPKESVSNIKPAYNLRTRNSPVKTMVLKETPSQFAKEVKTRKSRQSDQVKYYSSDED